MAYNLKLLHVALQRKNYNLAAHVLVYGMVKASIEVREKHAHPAAISVQSGIHISANSSLSGNRIHSREERE